MHRTLATIATAAVFGLAGWSACGGTRSGSSTGGGSTPGSGHALPENSGSEQIDVEGMTDGGLPAADAAPPAPVTFVLHNTAEEDLVLNMDKGYQPVILAYSGEPPNAKSILMFPTHCTASCDAPEEERCPVCEEPENVRDIKAAEKRIVIPPGEAHEVPWDLKTYVYERTTGKNARGRRTRCQCWRQEEVLPPPVDYTVRACALRLTQTAEQRSKLQCVDGAMTLPPEEPIRVELEFPAP